MPVEENSLGAKSWGLFKKDHMDVLYLVLNDGFSSLSNINLTNNININAIVGKDAANTTTVESAATIDGVSVSDSSLQEQKLQNPRESHNSFVTINFIDPTSATGATMNNSRFNKGGSPQLNNRSSRPLPLELYEKLTQTFEKEYHSTLNNVPYQNIRTGRNALIDQLLVRPVLTRSHGGAGKAGSSMVPWGGTAGTAAAPVSDPAEWHVGPYCHVYIAACENMQHYRAKVKPSLQAFVSQIEGAANNSHPVDGMGSALPQASGNYSARYIIVFVPTGQRSADSAMESSTTASRMGAAFASRMAAAKKKLSDASARGEQQVSADSTHSQASRDSSDLDEMSESTRLSESTRFSPSATGDVLMSKQDKELFRRFNADFPNGTTCYLSSLLENVESEVEVNQKQNVQEIQEWHLFNRALGSAIVDGFKDRCRRYNDELRRLDSHRAQININRTKDQPISKNQKTAFDLSHFFLVKESLSFTYEQMQLPSEALLQYEELRAFVPDTDEAVEAYTKQKKAVQLPRLEGVLSNFDLAISGDTHGFRKRVRAVTDLVPIAHVVTTYLFSREIRLLFKMRDPVELIQRCQTYIETMYSFMTNGIGNDLDESTKLHYTIEAEKWAVVFCWEVKCAAQSYFNVFKNWMKDATDGVAMGWYTHPKSTLVMDEYASASPTIVFDEQALARQLSEILDFARLRLMRVGDACFSYSKNPIRIQRNGTPNDLTNQWEPWGPPASLGESEAEDDASFDIFCSTKEVLRPFTFSDDEVSKDCLSDSVFVSRYMELTSAIATMAHFSGRRRQGARLEGEVAGILISRGDYRAAIKAMIPTVGVLAKDHWQRCHFWYLFRLACCQRRVSKPHDYCKTLINCFGPRMKDIAPTKAQELLLTDLNVVASSPQISGTKFGMVPFMGTKIEVEKTTLGESAVALGPERRQLQKKLCAVGDSIRINLHVSSYLPRPIEFNFINLNMIAFDCFAPKMEEKSPLSKDDIANVLSLSNPGPLNPGLNKFCFDWIPVKPGQFILSSSEFSWKNTSFHFESLEMRRPLVGLQVVPSEPTQSMKIEPFHLVPGHIQPVKIVYQSGEDVVHKGVIQLNCSQGLKLIPPGENSNDIDGDNWKDNCEILLPSCIPGEEIVFNLTVKPWEKSSSLDINIETFYCHSQAVGAEESGKEDHVVVTDSTSEKDLSDLYMKTVLSKTISTLDKSVFTAEGTEVIPFSDNEVLIKISLLCNSPVPFTIKQLQLCIPPPLILREDGDLNENFFNIPVSEEEELSFGFICKLMNKGVEEEWKDEAISSSSSLKIQLVNSANSVFSETLNLDLKSFYDSQLANRRIPQVLSSSGTTSNRCVTVELKNCAKEGAVGAPVTFSYVIQSDSLLQLKDEIKKASVSSSEEKNAELPITFFYSVDCSEKEWLVGGNVKGRVDVDNSNPLFCLEIIAIPTREGVISIFPTISLSCSSGWNNSNNSNRNETFPIGVDMQQPDAFNSLAYFDLTAVACPTSGVANR